MEMAIAVTVLGLAFFLLFRKNIDGAISRMRNIDKSGVAFDSVQRGAQPERDPPSEAEALKRELDNALVREAEDFIKNEFKKRGLSVEESLNIAIRYLAATHLALQFENVFRIIWGSQLRLLSDLNTRPTGQPIDTLKSFYESGAKVFPDVYKNYPFEKWLGFLQEFGLIRSDNGTIRVTVRGREFLTYLTREGRSLEKLG